MLPKPKLQSILTLYNQKSQYTRHAWRGRCPKVRGRFGFNGHMTRVSLHNFSHAPTVYSTQQAKDISDLKAISMNLMHENLQVPDGVYGIFSNIDVQKRITTLSERETTNIITESELRGLLEKIIREVRS